MTAYDCLEYSIGYPAMLNGRPLWSGSMRDLLTPSLLGLALLGWGWFLEFRPLAAVGLLLFNLGPLVWLFLRRPE